MVLELIPRPYPGTMQGGAPRRSACARGLGTRRKTPRTRSRERSEMEGARFVRGWRRQRGFERRGRLERRRVIALARHEPRPGGRDPRTYAECAHSGCDRTAAFVVSPPASRPGPPRRSRTPPSYLGARAHQLLHLVRRKRLLPRGSRRLSCASTPARRLQCERCAITNAQGLVSKGLTCNLGA